MNKNQIIRPGTLGPHGTSSEQATLYCVQSLMKVKVDNLSLYDTFDDVLTSLVNDKINIAVVPHAYEGINKFYINPQLELQQMFIHDTPRYGIYKSPGVMLQNKHCMIVSHPAPVVLMEYLIAKQVEITQYTVDLVNSTSVAASMVHDRKVEAAITNENAAKLYNLELLAMYGPIRMGWSVFRRSES